MSEFELSPLLEFVIDNLESGFEEERPSGAVQTTTDFIIIAALNHPEVIARQSDEIWLTGLGIDPSSGPVAEI